MFDFIDEKTTLLIVNAGFEERSINYLNIVKPRKSNIHVYMIDDFSNQEINKCNEITYMKMKENFNNVELKKIKYNDPIMTYRSMISFTYESFNDIYIDITSFTDEHLLILLNTIRKQSTCSLNFVYSSPESYHHVCEGNSWLSRGTLGLRNVLGYPGVFSPTKENHLIIVAGYEYDRVKSMIETVESDKVTVCFGGLNGSVNKKFFDKARDVSESLMRDFTELNIEQISMNEVDECFNNLKEIIDNKYNTMIAPLGNKISTLAIFKAHENNEDIQIQYVPVQDYNLDYSRGTGKIFNVKL